MGVDRAWLGELRHKVVREDEPGLTLVFDLPIEIGLSRAVASQRYERMGREFHDKLRHAFQEIAQARDGRHRVVIDAGGTPDEVARDVHAVVTATYQLKS